MKANITLKVDSGKTGFYMLLPTIACEKTNRSYAIAFQMLNRYAEFKFTFGD